MVSKPVLHSTHGNSAASKAKKKFQELGFKAITSFFQKPTETKGKSPASSPTPTPSGIRSKPKPTANAPPELDPDVAKPKHVSPAFDPCIPEAEEIDENWNGLDCSTGGVLLQYFRKDAPYASDDSDDSDYPGLGSMPCSDSEIG